MFRKGDVVVRQNSPLEGSVVKGTVAVVKRIIDADYMTLEGHDGRYMQSHFRLNTQSNPERTVVGNDLESVENALRTIDNWNRTHPTPAMISIESGNAQDGGSIFVINDGYDSHNVSDIMVHLTKFMSDADRKAGLLRMKLMIDRELGDE